MKMIILAAALSSMAPHEEMLNCRALLASVYEDYQSAINLLRSANELAMVGVEGAAEERWRKGMIMGESTQEFISISGADICQIKYPQLIEAFILNKKIAEYEKVKRGE